MPSPSDRREGLLAGVFLSALAAVLAVPSLWEAWRHDPYAAGGLGACIVWLASLGLTSGRLRATGGGKWMVWIVLAALLCALGSLTSLRICHHLALACALCAVAAPAHQAWLAAAGALSWLPATGWFISRWHKGGLAGWERPALAAAAGLVLFLCMNSASRKSKP